MGIPDLDRRCFLMLAVVGMAMSYKTHFPSSGVFNKAKKSALGASVSVGDRERLQTEGGDWKDVIVSALVRLPPVVAIARDTLVTTAKSVGVDWEEKFSLIENARSWEDEVKAVVAERGASFKTPSYYYAPFHAYSEGNLCLQAAMEQELAGKGVGARNFPNEGINGENFLRTCYETQIATSGGKVVPAGATVVDFACGTGTSTRKLAKFFPQAGKVIGIDLSPQMVAVGRFLLGQAKNASFEWIDNIEADDRISLQYGDVADTGLPSNSVAFVSVSLLLHELPQHATKSIMAEAHRILAPGGVLALMDMDPEAPGHVKLQQKPLLFSVLRSTEPYLGEWFALAPALPKVLQEIGFPVVRTTAATGRHLAMVAVKGGSTDMRPEDDVREKSDLHMNTMQKEVRSG